MQNRHFDSLYNVRLQYLCSNINEVEGADIYKLILSNGHIVGFISGDQVEPYHSFTGWICPNKKLGFFELNRQGKSHYAYHRRISTSDNLFILKKMHLKLKNNQAVPFKFVQNGAFQLIGTDGYGHFDTLSYDILSEDCLMLNNLIKELN